MSKTVPEDANGYGPALLHRSLAQPPIEVVGGKGSYIFTKDGRKILDACGGAAVVCIGHGREEISNAALAQMKKIAYVHTGTFTTNAAEELAKTILSYPSDFQHGIVKAYFVNSGSEATDSAVKFATQYFHELGQKQRKNIVSRKGSYHGNTIAAMSVSTNQGRKIPYDGIITLPNVSHVSKAHSYREQKPGQSDEDFVTQLITELETEFQRLGPETVMAFIAETVIGATSGTVCAPRGYFTRVRELCDKYGILLILDEVMCGMGRTGTYFAFQQENVRPDLLTVGKCLGSGYAPIAGLLVSDKVIDVLSNGSKVFNHGHTYQAHPLGCAMALEVQKIVLNPENNLVDRAAKYGTKLKELLHCSLDDCKFVGDIRGRGLFLSVEFVEDKKTKKSLPRQFTFAAKVQEKAFDMDVSLYPGLLLPDGADSDHVLIAPSYTVTDEELDIIVKSLRCAYDQIEAKYLAEIKDVCMQCHLI